MDTMASGVRVERRRRRRYSEDFKVEAVRACSQPGVSVASVALARGLNANLLRRWLVEAERSQALAPVKSKSIAALEESFVALPIQPGSSGCGPIQIELRRGGLTLSVQWPSSAMHECAMWLREVLK